MAEKVDMSLDDIISMSKKRRGGGGGGGSRGRTTNRGRSRGRASGSPRGLRSGGRGGVQKRRSGSFGRTRNLNDDAVWEHDLYDGGRGKPQIARSYQTQSQEARLMVSNLDFAVNDSDISELFAECGPLKRGIINYDRSGRSLGTAEVVFERRSDAVKALKQYNNVPLDGLPMQIEMIGGVDEQNGTSRGFSARRLDEQNGTTRGFSARRLASRRQTDDDRATTRSRTSGSGGGGGGGGRTQSRGRGRGGRGRGGRTERKQPTAEELDAQLDAYATTMDTE